MQYIVTMDKAKKENKYYWLVFAISIVAAVLVATMPWMGTVGMANPKTAAAPGLWMNFFGQLHPLFLHLPIGATVLVISMEGLGLISRGKYKPNTTIPLAFAAGTAIFAVVFGYFLHLTGEYKVEELADHKRDGIIFTVWIILTFLAKYTYDSRKFTWLKPGYLIALVATTGMMMSAGHYGGEITHGDPLNSLPSKILAERKAEEEKPVVTDPVIYANIVHGILKNKCISCHGEDKVKGGLRLDSMAAILEGGDEEECVVPGDIEGSYMITTILLPEDDDMHMPPKAKPQVTAEELSILKWWIEMGAPEETKLSEVTVPVEITTALATLKSPEELAREKEQIRLAEEKAKKAFKEKRANLEEVLYSVNEAFPGSLRYNSQEDTDLVFNSVSYRKTFKGSDLQMLEPVAAEVIELDLSSTNLTDTDAVHLEKFINLKNLKLNGTKITDEALKSVSKLENLQSLNLFGTNVTDAGIMEISNLKHLEKTYLWNTEVTPAGATQLQEALKESSADDKKIVPTVELGKTVSD